MPALILPHLPAIDEYSPEQLDEAGFYIGFPCPHGHVIRNKKYHYCYHCAHKISQNICGFDWNYLHPAYKSISRGFFDFVHIKGPNECWEWLDDINRQCFPGYRSGKGRRSENMRPQKVMYHIAWGDTGNLYVQRNRAVCTNPNCVNPLHLKTNLNLEIPPKTIHPLEKEIDWAKVKQYYDLAEKGLVDKCRHRELKCHIKPPLLVPDRDKDTFD